MLQNLRTTSEGDEVIAVYQPTDDDFIKVNFESLDVLSQLHPLHERRLFSSRRDTITPPPPLSNLLYPHPTLSVSRY